MASDPNGVLQLIDKARDILDVVQRDAKKAARLVTKLSEQNTQPTTQANMTNIKLPKLELPMFSGNILKWPEFWSAFEAAVDRQPIPDINKLNYLLSSLKGFAHEVVEGYAVTSSNYRVVVSVLKERFGNERIIIKSLHDELKRIRQADPKNPSQTINEIERVLRQLEAMNEDIKHPIIELIVEENLPKWLLINIYEWDINKLREYINEVVIRREEVDRITNNSIWVSIAKKRSREQKIDQN
ncbi:unnamed protein product [Anisakis simplex]|uniref:Gag protein n=1 Tax=Anisakis simplex TaxID=6269 RepID=A0A0M3K2U7_ANISI|nr:unnamed protein product [Anisakis simplex]